MDKTYDVVVIGGGAAGLSGALALGRARRSVLVVDDRSPRNAPAHGVHNYLGREGTPPSEVEQYGVEIVDDSATAAERLADGTLSVALSGRRVLARRLLVATGVIDDLPDLPGIKEGWGENVIHCPYCHGWEVRDQRLGVLATGPMSTHQALLFRQWSDDIVLFVHEWTAPSDDEAEQLAARGIAIVTGDVAAWRGTAVQMASGELVPRDALVVGAPFRARSLVLSSLGLEAAAVEMNGHVIGTHIAADQTGLTAVPGVWVAGNLTNPMAQVIASAASGLMAGAMINADLVNEETRVAVEHHGVFSESAWERVYTAEEQRWSGEPNRALVLETEDLAVGSALDVGCGEGADSLWLAGKGWHVTGVDISATALERAAAQAHAQGLHVEWRHADVMTAGLGSRTYDLVTAHYMHLPTNERTELYTRLAAAVAPGGTLLLVGHHPSHEHIVGGHHERRDMYFTAEQLLDELDLSGWAVVTVATRPRGDNHLDGQSVDDAVLRVRRPHIDSGASLG